METALVTIQDASTGSQLAASFANSNNGYLVFDVKGHVEIQITDQLIFSSLYGRLQTAASPLGAIFFDPVSGSNQPPTVATPASASPSAVTGTTTNLSVLGADDAGEANLTYTWAETAGPAGVSFSARGTNAAKNVAATFSQTGDYTFQATITDPSGLSVTSSVSVTVNQTLSSIQVSPVTVTISDGALQQFTATGIDQFGNALAAQPTFAWSLDGGSVGTIGTDGQYTAPASGTGSATVRATSGTVSGTGSVTVHAASTGLHDGGFEAPNVGNGSFQYDPSGVVWNFSGGAGVSGNGSGFTSGNANAPEGTQVGFLQGTGSFSQTVTLAAGNYQVSFQAAQRANYGGAQAVRVLVDGTAVGTLSGLTDAYAAYTTSPFSAVAGSHTITYQWPSGEAAYRLYIEHALPHLQNLGGELLFLGRGGPFLIGPADERWDVAMLVRQSSIAAFVAFASNPEYLSGIGHRLAALEDSRLLPLVEGGVTEIPSVP